MATSKRSVKTLKKLIVQSSSVNPFIICNNPEIPEEVIMDIIYGFIYKNDKNINGRNLKFISNNIKYILNCGLSVIKYKANKKIINEILDIVKKVEEEEDEDLLELGYPIIFELYFTYHINHTFEGLFRYYNHDKKFINEIFNKLMFDESIVDLTNVIKHLNIDYSRLQISIDDLFAYLYYRSFDTKFLNYLIKHNYKILDTSLTRFKSRFYPMYLTKPQYSILKKINSNFEKIINKWFILSKLLNNFEIDSALKFINSNKYFMPKKNEFITDYNEVKKFTTSINTERFVSLVIRNNVFFDELHAAQFNRHNNPYRIISVETFNHLKFKLEQLLSRF